MDMALFKKIGLLIAIIGVGIVLLVQWISSLPKTLHVDANIEITAEMGERLFWGRGRCYICHQIGNRGGALRGPNLGKGKDGNLISERAKERARQLNLLNATDYLVQSLVEPQAFIVPGYKNEMPPPYKAPIYLSPSEIKAIIFYLATLNGDTLNEEIKLPEHVFAAGHSSTKSAKKWNGDVEKGRTIFFDPYGPANCASCHTARDRDDILKGGSDAVDLSTIGAIRTAEYIYEKIIKPGETMVSGYEEETIISQNGRIYIGTIQSETGGKVLLKERTGETVTIEKTKIRSRSVHALSAMPQNYEDLLTEEQLRDLVAFLITQTGE